MWVDVTVSELSLRALPLWVQLNLLSWFPDLGLYPGRGTGRWEVGAARCQ